MPSKKFSLASVLNYGDGRLFSSMDEVHELAAFMVGQPVFTHHLPQAYEKIRPAIREQLPWLNSDEYAAKANQLTKALSITANPEDCICIWLKEAEKQFGASHEILPLNEWDVKKNQTLKTFICTSFKGHTPTGTAAVVVDTNPADAAKALMFVLEKESKLIVYIDASKMVELPTDRRSVRVLNDGDY